MLPTDPIPPDLSNTEAKKKKPHKGTENLIPFKKGKGADRDPRINPNGRPKGFDEFRKLVLSVGSEVARDKKNNPVIIDKGLPTEHAATIAELILRDWAKDKQNSQKFVEYGWGKVPQPIEHSGNVQLTWRDFIEGDGSNLEVEDDNA